MVTSRWPYPSFPSPDWLGADRGGDPILVGAIRTVHELLRASGFPVDDRPETLLAALAVTAQLADRLDWLLLSLVGEARAHDLSWAQVGGALGVTKQAAHARFSGVVAEALRRAEEAAAER